MDRINKIIAQKYNRILDRYLHNIKQQHRTHLLNNNADESPDMVGKQLAAKLIKDIISEYKL